jgi:hypothetical protein
MSTTTKKLTLEIDASLYRSVVAMAKRNGQSLRFVIEQALELYLHKVASQPLVRREVMDAFEQSVARNSDLLDRLAK